jgi:hypothetical protein
MKSQESIGEFMKNVENVVNELVIVLLSVGAITVSIYSLFFASDGVDFIQFGRIIFPWITMLALMIIGRELWLANNAIQSYIEQEGEE